MRFGSSCLIALLAATSPVMAEDAVTAPQILLLSVILNGRATGSVVPFKQLPDGKLAANANDLRAAGIKPKTGSARKDGLIPLDTIAGVSWSYDEPNQAIVFKANENAQEPTSIDVGAASRPIDFSNVRSDLGLVMNYTLYGTSEYEWGRGGPSGTSLSGSFDSRFLTPYGTGTTSALARLHPLNTSGSFTDLDTNLIRLESAWRYTDPENMLVYQAGDSISGGLSWNSAYRFGGIQIKRNFDIRPDLVTSPVPNLTGSASVPSTLDLYLNNIRVFSGDVPAGPFDFKGLPFLGGGGDARIVMRDELGREVVTQRQYFFAPDMLRTGYVDFSAEAGFVRLGYGDESFLYDRDVAGSVSARYGLSDRITLESHVEATNGLINGGAGFVASLGPYGAFNASFISSTFEGETGGKASAFYQVSRNGYAFYIGADRMMGDYNDIGLVVDRRHDNDTPISARARKIDRVGFSFPLGFDPSSLSVGFSRIAGAGKDGNSSVLTASWSRTVFNDATIYVSGYADLDDHHKAGIFAGLSIPLGGDMVASSNVSNSANGTIFDNSLTKAARLEEGSLGWSLHDQETTDGTGSRSAAVNYRAGIGTFSGSVDQSGDQGRITGTVEGSVVAAGGGVFMANRVDDAFAVVKAGGPKVDVSLNSRRVATTNKTGRAFVPYLQSYQYNTIAIDPANLALDVQPESTQSVVVPADRSGVVVDFGTRKVNAAIGSLIRADGKAVPTGAVVQLDGATDSTVAGYDGRAYLTGLGSRNNVTVTLPEDAGTCHASFDYRAAAGTQPEIGPVPCR